MAISFEQNDVRRARATLAPFAGFDTIHSDVLRGFPELVAELGGDIDAVFRCAGIRPRLLAVGDRRIGYRAFVSLLEQAALVLDCPDFGMRLASRQGGLPICGILGSALKTAMTFGDALDYAESHAFAHSLAAQIRIHRDEDAHIVFVTHNILLENLPQKRQALEQILLLAHLTSHQMTAGQVRVRKVLFRHEPVSALSDYRRYFGCEVRFGSPVDAVGYAESDLCRPTVSADQQAYRATVSEIGRTFTEISPPMHAQVRGVVLEMMGKGPCINLEVAEALGLHPRALYRRLKAEGKTFHMVKDEVRRDAALYYLLWTKLPFMEIASRLGFAEQSVFTRSCVNWFAASPRTIRVKAQSPGVTKPSYGVAA